MNKLKLISMLVSIFMTLPIWLYLLYKILESVGASDLMWFLYYIYIPVALISGLLSRFIEDDSK